MYAAEFGWDHTFEAYVAGPLAEFAKSHNDRERIWIVERDGKVARFDCDRRSFEGRSSTAFATYGSDEHKEPISETIPELRVKVRTNNNIALTHLLLRAQPRTGNVRPYADALIGFKYLFTNTTILNDSNGEELASTKNLSDLVFSYGFGGGVQVRLGRVGRSGDIALDGKVRYLRGARAEYLKEGSVRREDGSVFFDVLSSRTDVVAVQIGVTFRF